MFLGARKLSLKMRVLLETRTVVSGLRATCTSAAAEQDWAALALFREGRLRLLFLAGPSWPAIYHTRKWHPLTLRAGDKGSVYSALCRCPGLCRVRLNAAHIASTGSRLPAN